MKVGALVSEYGLTQSIILTTIEGKAAFKIVTEKCTYNTTVRGN
jgi:hypothetical protein